MPDKKMVLGLTHIDLGWLKGRAEMAQILDNYLVQLFDLIEQHPNFHYLLEQALHYRDLKSRRPDLFQKLKHYVRQGILEFATPLASTIENNLTNGESFVRNMQLGAAWIAAEFDMQVYHCMMIDTFGFPPQMPQVLRQFGYKEMFASRLGGGKIHDVFTCTGLDGTNLLVAGWDLQTSYAKPRHISHQFCKDRSALDSLFERAQQGESQTSLVMPYTENETPPDPYIIELVEQNDADAYRFATFSDFWQQLYASNEDWPQESADLNPEFSGAFSLRHLLKERNRKTEELLLAAEKLCALAGEHTYDQLLEDAWWEMAYLQFHDILTGSHPTAVYQDCMARFDQVETEAQRVVHSIIRNCGEDACRQGQAVYTVYNGLPWARTQTLCIDLKQEWQGVDSVRQDGKPIAFCVRDHRVSFEITLAAMSSAVIEINRSQHSKQWSSVPIEKIENDTLLIEFGGSAMIRQIVHKPTARVIVKNCNNILTLQRDWGSYQIEAPAGLEIPCGAGEYQIAISQEFGCQQAVITGLLPAWDSRTVNYQLTFTLPEKQPYVDLAVDVDWNIPSARLRLNLPTTLGATENYYEVPFGVTKRSPYGRTETAQGEWAAHRFVAMDNEAIKLGVALANTGCAGAETSNGTLKATLLRAPHRELAGMIPDGTSSDPGHHSFQFRMLAYAGSWVQSGILRYAQELNSPCLAVPGVRTVLPSALAIDASNIVLSAVKNTATDLVAIRLYESAGMQTQATLAITGVEQVLESDLRESPLGPLPFGESGFSLSFAPFEIKTILVRRCPKI